MDNLKNQSRMQKSTEPGNRKTQKKKGNKDKTADNHAIKDNTPKPKKGFIRNNIGSIVSLALSITAIILTLILYCDQTKQGIILHDNTVKKVTDTTAIMIISSERFIKASIGQTEYTLLSKVEELNEMIVKLDNSYKVKPETDQMKTEIDLLKMDFTNQKLRIVNMQGNPVADAMALMGNLQGYSDNSGLIEFAGVRRGDIVPLTIIHIDYKEKPLWLEIIDDLTTIRLEPK
jgi:hypothetical protein